MGKLLSCIIMLVVYLLCAPSSVARGQEDRWRLHHTGGDGGKYFYDSQSIVRIPKAIKNKARKRFIRSRRRTEEAWMVKVKEKIVFNSPGNELTESNVLREFDCAARKVHTLMRSDLYKDNAMQVKGKSGVWEEIDSKPCLGSLYRIVCPS